MARSKPDLNRLCFPFGQTECHLARAGTLDMAAPEDPHRYHPGPQKGQPCWVIDGLPFDDAFFQVPNHGLDIVAAGSQLKLGC